MKYIQLLLILFFPFILLGQNSNFYNRSSSTIFDQLVWADEFDVNGAIDSNKWFHQTKLPSGGNWYNGEIQHYTDRIDNSVVANGVLKIIAKKETYTDQGVTKDYTSARLNSKFSFKYGRVEVRAKLPFGIGTWPAIWTLGKNIIEDGAYFDIHGYGTTAWPACGEIDIMEHWGSNQNYVQSATHTPSSYGATTNLGGRMIPNVSTSYHIYSLEWTPEKLVFSVDSIVHYTYNPTIKDANTWPFDKEQYLLLNIAIQASISANFTSSAMEIDYVRIYQESGVSNNNIEQEINFNVFPNPFSNKLNVEFAGDYNDNIDINIYSIEGKLIKNKIIQPNNKNITIDNLGDLPSGIYLLKLKIGNSNYTRKVLKK